MSLRVCIQTFSVSFLPYVFGVVVLTFPQYFRRACVPPHSQPVGVCVYIMVRLEGFEPENYCVCKRWWAGPDLNRRPSARQADVLTVLDYRPSMFVGYFQYIALNSVQLSLTFRSTDSAPSAGSGKYAVLGGMPKLQTGPFQGLFGSVLLTSSIRQ